MANEKCKECKRDLVLDEENLCAYCELTQDMNEINTPDVNCGTCKVIVEEDSEGLFCDVCKSWFHNYCNETPLNNELYTLLNEAPNNVKWFCDKCIWETEKWIKELNNKNNQTSGEVHDEKKIINKLNKKSHKVDKENEEANGDENEENAGITEDSDEEIHEDNEEYTPSQSEMRVETDNESDVDEDLDDDDSDEWVPDPKEEKEEVIKMNPKKKQNNKQSENKVDENIMTLSETIVAENISNILDISPESLSNITDRICSVKIHKSKNTRTKCKVCSKAFLHLEEAIAHILRDHEGIQKPFKCSVCNQTFDTRRHRNRHMVCHSSERNFTCDICAKKLKTSEALRHHQKMYHSESDAELHSCMECDYKTKWKGVLKQHLVSKHSCESKFKCKICNKSFISSYFLKTHSSVHSSDRPFACEVCNNKFKTEKHRKKHMLSRHSTVKPFECAKCYKKYATKDLLTRHNASHNPKGEKTHACDQCDSRFIKMSYLKTHKERHTGVLNVICDICGKGFRDANYLKIHTLLHSDERPYKCEICGKGFKLSGHLSIHIKYHKKIVAARCQICGFGAPSKSVLTQHIKLVHTNETPFECDICGNKYKTNGNLSKHKRGIRGSCKGFKTSDSLVQEKREPKTYHMDNYEQIESKDEDSSISIHETGIASDLVPTVQTLSNHKSFMLYANSHNSNAYATQYHASLIPPNSRGITATIQTSPIRY